MRGDCVEQMALAVGQRRWLRGFAEQINAQSILTRFAAQSSAIRRCSPRQSISDEIYGDLGLPVGFCQADLFSMVFTGGEDQLLNRLISALKTGSVTDQKNAGKTH